MRLFEAFERGTVPLQYYADLSQKIYAVKTGLIMASIVSGDVIIVSRSTFRTSPDADGTPRWSRFIDSGWYGIASAMSFYFLR